MKLTFPQISAQVLGADVAMRANDRALEWSGTFVPRYNPSDCKSRQYAPDHPASGARISESRSIRKPDRLGISDRSGAEPDTRYNFAFRCPRTGRQCQRCRPSCAEALSPRLSLLVSLTSAMPSQSSHQGASPSGLCPARLRRCSDRSSSTRGSDGSYRKLAGRSFSRL